MPGRVGHARPPPPEEAAQDAALQRLQQRALPGSRVSEELEFDPGLDCLSGPQLLDVAQLVVVLNQKHTTEEDIDSSGHRHLYTTPTRPQKSHDTFQLIRFCAAAHYVSFKLQKSLFKNTHQRIVLKRYQLMWNQSWAVL